jgi:hypothetical protein
MSLVIRASKTNRKDAFAFAQPLPEKRLVGVASRREEKYKQEERKEEKLTMSLPQILKLAAVYLEIGAATFVINLVLNS